MNKQQNLTKTINKILSGARWSIALRLTGQIVSWVGVVVVVRFISPEDYGLNAQLEAPLVLLSLFSTLGLNLALVRAKSIEQDKLRSVFGLLCVVNGLLFLVYFFGGALLATYFNEPRLELLAKALAFLFLMTPFRVIPDALLDRDLKFKLKSIAEFTATICAVITTLVLAILGAGIWALVIGALTRATLEMIMLTILQPWLIAPSLSFAPVRTMLVFGGILTLTDGIIISADQLVVPVAGPVLGTELLGIFTVAFQFALLPLSKIMPVINPIIFPAFSKLQDQYEAAGYYFGKTIGTVSLACFPVMIGLACIAQEFVEIVLGHKWQAVALPLALLCIAMPFRMTICLLRPVLNSMGRPDLSLKSAIASFVILLSLMLIFIQGGYSLIVLIVAMMLTELIVTIFTIRMSNAVLDISFTDIGRSLSPAIVSSAVMAVGVLGAKFTFASQAGIAGLLIEIGLGALIYVLMLRIFYRKLLEDTIRLVLRKKNSEEESSHPE